MPPTSADLDALRTVVNTWVAMPAAAWSQFATCFTARTAEVNATVALPGMEVHELYFVCDGLLRFYYVDDAGRQTNKAFVAAHQFAGAYAAMALHMPVLYGVEALEPSRLLVARFEDLVALFDEHPAFDRFGRRLAEWILARKEQRARSLLQMQAADRYHAFCAQHPDLIQRVPQYHIASYLGITESSLSRIRRTSVLAK